MIHNYYPISVFFISLYWSTKQVLVISRQHTFNLSFKISKFIRGLYYLGGFFQEWLSEMNLHVPQLVNSLVITSLLNRFNLWVTAHDRFWPQFTTNLMVMGLSLWLNSTLCQIKYNRSTFTSFL